MSTSAEGTVARKGTPEVSLSRARLPPGARSTGKFRLLRGYRLAVAVLLLPSILLIAVFSYYPAVRSLIGGFYAWNGFSAPTYVGFAQFDEYLHSPNLEAEVRNLAI